MKIKIFATGGTFDKEYNEISEQLIVQETHIPEMLRIGRSKVEVDVRTLMSIDSLTMTETDRKTIAENCFKAAEKNIVIIHGTGTMADTARVLAASLLQDKTIVLTGAMVPFRVVGSDALFNLGTALAFVQSLPPGIYIAINGQYFNANNVIKDTTSGTFQEIK